MYNVNLILPNVVEPEEKGHPNLHNTDVQDIMDAMMKETMNKTQDVPMDTDSDVTPQEVIISPDNSRIIKSEERDIKVEVKEENSIEGIKSEKINHQNIRVNYEI